MEEKTIFHWTDEDVFHLIELRKIHNVRFTGKKGSAQRGWAIIAKLLNNGATDKNCKKRWENLMSRYKDIVTSPVATEDGSLPTDWIFFNTVHEFLSTRHVKQENCSETPFCVPSSSGETPSPLHLSSATSSQSSPSSSPLQQSSPSSPYTVSAFCSTSSNSRKRKGSEISELLEFLKEEERKKTTELSDLLTYLKEQEERQEMRHREITDLFSETIDILKKISN